MSRWRSIALVARREILERGRSRGFVLSVLFTTLLVVGSIVVPAIFLDDDKPTPRGRRRSRPRPRSSRRSAPPRPQFDRPDRDHDVPRRGERRRPPSRTGPWRPWSARPPTCPVPGTIQVKDRPDQALAQLLSSAVIARPDAVRPGRLAASTDGAHVGRAGAGPERTPSPDRRRPGAVHRRQHRRRAHPGRHLQLRVHGPDRRRRGEAEPGRRGRPLDRPPARPADGQGARDRRPGARPAAGLRRRRVRRGIAREPGRPCPRRRPARSDCSRCGSSSATRCTRRRSASSARSRRGWRRPRTRRPR